MTLMGPRPPPSGGGRGTLGATGTAATRVIIDHRFAELGMESVIPWRHRRSSMALRRGRRSPLKVSGETFSILDLIAALYYVGRLHEIGEITRPIVST